MKRRTLLWWLAGALVAGIGAECATGGPGPRVDAPEKGADPEREMPPVDGPEDRVDQQSGVTIWGANISVWVAGSACPYTVEVFAVDHSDDNRELSPGKHTIERGRYVCPLSFPAGHSISGRIVVHARKAGKGYIEVREGGFKRRGPAAATALAGRRDVELVFSLKRK